MKKSYLAAGILFTSLTGSLPTLAANPGTPSPKEEAWKVDFAAAQAQAVREGKDLLVDFTGSDWCEWCIKQDEEVFEKAEFTSAAQKNFVLVRADFPHDETKQTAAVIAQNEALKEKYGVMAFPTVLLLDAQGRLYYWKAGYSEGGPVRYASALAEWRKVREKRDAFWNKAASVSGPARARLLAQGLDVFETGQGETNEYNFILKYYGSVQIYGEVIDEIIALDPKNETGLPHHFSYLRKLFALMNTLWSKEKQTELLEKVDKLITEDQPKGEDLQKAIYLKSDICKPYSLENLARSLKYLDQAIAIDPKTSIAQEARYTKEHLFEIRKKLEKKLSS